MEKVRRLVKAILLSIAGVVGFVINVILVGLIFASIDKRDSFVLRNASFEDANYLRRPDLNEEQKSYNPSEPLPIYAHRLKRGSGTIFAWRFYSNGQLWIIDDESYQKLTIWIADRAPSSSTTIPLGDHSRAVLIFSHGGSAWPRSECCGYGTAGSITITPSGRRFTIAIHAQITPVGTRSIGCANKTVDRTFKAKEIAFESLTPWLGIAGRHPYDESYR